MKFLLVAINAKYIHSNPAIYSLRSYAGKELRQYVELAEYTINNRMEQILFDIYRRKPKAVGFSCYIWNWDMVRKLIRELVKVLPEVPIWLGGPEVSYDQEKIFEWFPEITGIIPGEGEETFRELLQNYVMAESTAQAAEKKNLRELMLTVPGTVTRVGAYEKRGFLDMNKLPFYYEELSAEEEAAAENRIIYYETGRGCPYRCSYCLSSIEKEVRLRDVAQVKKELGYFLDKKVRQVKFIDRTFNCNRERALEIWRFLLENDNGVTNFHFEIAGELLGEEELALFARMRAGLIQLEIGVQTTNPETLRAIHRPCHLETLSAKVISVYRLGNIHQHLDLIAGLPFEDRKSFRKSFDDVYAMKPHQLQLGFLKVLKGSEMRRRAEEYGIVYQSEPPYEVLYTKWLSYEDIREFKQVEEMVELFYNSNQFTHTLRMLEKFFESAYELYLSLAKFYEEKGFFVNSPARSYRYEVLFRFIKTRVKEEEQEALFRELLTFDIYLRENAKSRPVFARDLGAWKQEIMCFYRKQEEAPDILKEYAEKGFSGKQMAHMTHMDIFCYPVWDKEWLEKEKPESVYAGKETMVLFDYEKRNAMTHEAAYEMIKK